MMGLPVDVFLDKVRINLAEIQVWVIGDPDTADAQQQFTRYDGRDHEQCHNHPEQRATRSGQGSGQRRPGGLEGDRHGRESFRVDQE
jgi:hypothetical protein